MVYEESQVTSRPGLGRTYGDLVFPHLQHFEDHIVGLSAINEFSKRDLSFDRDALDAVSGILNIYRSQSTRDSGVAVLYGVPLTLWGKFPEERHKSLCETSVLIQGLSWTGIWEEKPIGIRRAELSSTKLERPRRSEFLSWT
ncbi:hypothetical protein B0T09DRAFT_88384 [Sordaria sp. MPI-SDFR-AT-0083]|nr:hypothetical protein B0T09DRAFT_88384 [Sordaria sp. MPI-SDFR-AT-0083]